VSLRDGIFLNMPLKKRNFKVKLTMCIDLKIKPGSSIYFVGIKGTGVCALAELMHNAGVKVSGSDTNEKFYTDEILKELKIPYYENFDATHISLDISMVIHSAAYNAETNPELASAVQLNIPVYKYTDALGAWSARFDSTGICGVHGKTTTTALSGVVMRAAGIPAQILTGSAAVDFGGRSTLNLGDKYFIAETCEYRKHFLSFHPKRIILTSVESDHQDFYPTYKSIRGAFVEYCRMLPEGGELIYCADDKGAREAAKIIEKEKRGIVLVPYGYKAKGDYKILSYKVENEKAVFTLAGFTGVFKMSLPGEHQALNASAVIALASILSKKESGTIQESMEAIKTALENFKSTKRRCEMKGEANGIIFMDDYGHHPTAIKSTLAGIKKFYPNRRLIVSFMPHTYSRTSALLNKFAGAFSSADIVILHKIYASAREEYSGGVTGKTLFKKVSAKCCSKKTVFYYEEPDDAFQPLCEMLKPGDLFLTLGAGNNWPLGDKLLAYFKKGAV
jgi:UDP-N-acetylmuramate--alanine ligase